MIKIFARHEEVEIDLITPWYTSYYFDINKSYYVSNIFFRDGESFIRKNKLIQ